MRRVCKSCCPTAKRFINSQHLNSYNCVVSCVLAKHDQDFETVWTAYLCVVCAAAATLRSCLPTSTLSAPAKSLPKTKFAVTIAHVGGSTCGAHTQLQLKYAQTRSPGVTNTGKASHGVHSRNSVHACRVEQESRIAMHRRSAIHLVNLWDVCQVQC